MGAFSLLLNGNILASMDARKSSVVSSSRVIDFRKEVLHEMKFWATLANLKQMDRGKNGAIVRCHNPPELGTQPLAKTILCSLYSL